MNSSSASLTAISLSAFLSLVISCSLNPAWSAEEPFARYLEEPEPSYRFSTVRIVDGPGYTSRVLLMKSQNWLDENMVDQPTWWHWLTIVMPDELKYPTGLLWIGGGDRDEPAPADAMSFLIEAAVRTGTVTASLSNVPFQPLLFAEDESGPRFEDGLLAYGWRVFMEKGAKEKDARRLLQLPMTKAVIRALDTITEYTAHLDPPVERFLVSGASKRGWAAWTTGIFDDRVVALVPMVIDLLNIRPSLEHHWQAYGEWSPAIRDYQEEGIMAWQLSAEFARSLELIDPYSYKEQLAMPKFIINAAGDEFFLPDSWRFYWEDLPGEKYLRYVPNAGHMLAGSDAIESLIAFYGFTVTGTPLPRFNWQVSDGIAIIETDPEQPPAELRLWQATNPERRDFRLHHLQALDGGWSSEVLPGAADGRFTITVDEPAVGFRAWFVEAVFPGPRGFPLKLSSGVVVTPDLYPFDPYVPDAPLGTITTEEEPAAP